MIVKIQQNIGHFEKRKTMLIYDKGREFRREELLTPEVEKWLEGRHKAYFDINFDGLSDTFVVKKEVEKQNW